MENWKHLYKLPEIATIFVSAVPPKPAEFTLVFLSRGHLDMRYPK